MTAIAASCAGADAVTRFGVAAARVVLLVQLAVVRDFLERVIVLQVVGLRVDDARVIARAIKGVGKDVFEVHVIAGAVVDIALGHDEITGV